MTPKAQIEKEKVDKLDFMKIYKFCVSKDNRKINNPIKKIVKGPE